MRGFLIVFGSVFLVELGDKTQIATFLFASQKGINRLVVFLGASLALVTTSFIAVVLGDYISKLVSPDLMKTLGGILFIILGILMVAKF
jgi:putative Ca2+/H+ antiporter (TMEM165/GDT1 family)